MRKSTRQKFYIDSIIFFKPSVFLKEMNIRLPSLCYY